MILRLDNQGHSIRKIGRITGHSRNTIRKVLDIRTPPPFKIYQRKSILYGYADFIREKFDIGTYTGLEIYKDIKEMGYKGSYSTVRRHISRLSKEKHRKSRQPVRVKKNKKAKDVKWLLNLLQCKFSLTEIREHFNGQLDSESAKELYDYISKGTFRYRNRAMVIFAYLNKIPKRTIADLLGANRNTVRNYIRKFDRGGTECLFNFSRKEIKKYEEPKYKEQVFKILHSPPATFSINRTTWRMEDLYKTMAEEGYPLSKSGIRKIIKNEGYRFLKAKKVLTSKDPDYDDKLRKITNILSKLESTEKFFSIDEFGPLAVKIHGGRSWTPPGKHKIVPQWQKSKGSLTLTAALELSTNQVTHFYSEKKNTNEMIKLLKILLKIYKDESRIFFSWDAASWHASKKLFEKVDEVNESAYRNIHKTPLVNLAPLPSGAQFLNIIESVFSGMARAIIHNSDYESVDICKAAIDQYFYDRNIYFKKHPQKAGKKIWGKERVNVVFSESHNCKDPKYC